jgi:hypothetical protein
MSDSRWQRVIAVTLAFGVCAAWSFSTAKAAELSPELAQVRANLEKYKDPVLAVHDGFLSTMACIDFPTGAPAGHHGQEAMKPGAMGVHFLNKDNIGPTVDPAKPQVLIYEPVGDKLQLVAAEWFVPLATGVASRPEIFGHPFEGPMEGHAPLLPVELHHYDLHVWLYRDNPAGLFHPTNANVKCPETGYTLHMAAPVYVEHPAPAHSH